MEKTSLIKRLKDKAVRTTVVGLVGLGGLVGCATTPYYPQNDFFTCNYWVDRNGDGSISRDEFVGMNKTRFRTNEKITLVASINGQRGNELSAKLISPERKILYSGKRRIPFDSQFTHPTFEGMDLYRKGGEGIYEMDWFINNNLVGVDHFTLIH